MLFGFLPVLLIAMIARTGKMDFELFIIEIENRDAIWDPREPKHCNRDFAIKFWSKIADLLKLEGYR